MHIRDYTAQTVSERLNDWVGQVVCHDGNYYLVVDCSGKYGWVNLETGHAALATSVEEFQRWLTHAIHIPTATLTIGDLQ
jgi:hypothetical protein